MPTLHEITITEPTRAIVCFGPATATSGMHPGAFFECVIDPHMQSPGGAFIRFEQNWQGGEIHGWQRIVSLTVCELLGAHEYALEPPKGYAPKAGESVSLVAVKSWAA